MIKLAPSSDRISSPPLPEELAQDRGGQIISEISLVKGHRWGPFPVESLSSGSSLEDADIKILKKSGNSDNSESFHIVMDKDRWVRTLGLSCLEEEDSVGVNTHILVNNSTSTVVVETMSDLEEGSILKADIFLIQNSPIPKTIASLPLKECPHCGIRFSSSSTLKAHMASYCSRRPVAIEKHTGGWPTRKRLSVNSTLRTTEPTLSPDLTALPQPPSSSSASTLIDLLPPHSAGGGVLQQQTVPPPLAFCAQCGLFFASKELFEIHMRLNRQQVIDGASGALVLAAPVVTTSGIQYIPIHPKTSVDLPASFSNLATSSVLSSIPPGTPTSPVKSRLANGETAAMATEELKPLDLRIPVPPSVPVTGGVHEQGGSPPVADHHILRHKQQLSTQEHLESQVNQMNQLIRRPFLCSYCNTRFQSRSTYQAHQQFYCQGRQHRELKRRRVQISADHPDTCPPAPELGSNSLGAWEEVKEGYRCVRCGYLGQTVRGMKMHSKLHDVQRAGMKSGLLAGLEGMDQDEDHENDGRSLSSPGDSTIDVVGLRCSEKSDCEEQHRTNSPLGLKNNCKTCRSCGSRYDHLEEFVRHVKFECTASKTIIKQEELSPA